MEVVEGGFRGDHGIIFKKIGPDLHVVEGGFSTIPVQALAVSNKYGLTFFVHSEGFCVARTCDLIEASQGLVDSPKDECNARQRSIASIFLPSIQSLALSKDELIIAVCLENKIHFYNIPALVQKEKDATQKDTALLKSLPVVDEKPGIKAFAWNPTQKDVILVLSRGGKLTTGNFAHDLKLVAEGVEAADWSPDGQFFCYITSDMNLHICKSDSSGSSSSKLPSEMFGEASNGGPEACVDTLKWACLGSILISCVHVDADGEEDDCWIFLLVSSKGHIAKDYDKAKILSFEQFFTSIDASILPPQTGPYVLGSYVQPWELLIITSRRSIDDHISLLGWLNEGAKSEAYKFELLDDRFTPRIELQASGDDNCVVGLAIDQTTLAIQLPAPNGESGEKLSPGPLLLCMTLEGNLSLFSLARTDFKWTNVEVVSTPIELPEADEVSLSYAVACKPPGKKHVGTQDAADKIVLSQGITDEPNKERQLETSAAVLETAGGMQLGPPDRRKDLSKMVRQAGTPGLLEQKPVHISTLPENKSRLLGSLGQTQVRGSAVSEVELDFDRELDKVKTMAREIEELMAFIEGRRSERKGQLKPLFTKFFLEDIECETQSLSTQCHDFREKLMEQRRSISDLRDESMQVDAWSVYVQSLLEQASDARYQELWIKQKHHPEMDAKRRRIFQVDQSLKQQIAELEEHLHNLELSQWQRKHNQSKHQAFSVLQNSEKFRCMQSLYDTVNTQMVVAQQLGRRLAMQMEVLKLPVIPREERESLISTSPSKLQDMVLEGQSLNKISELSSRIRAPLNSLGSGDSSPTRMVTNYSLQTPKKPDATVGTRTGLQDSTRRRRVSVDKLWIDVGAAKTTVKRAAQVKRFDGLSSSPNKGVLEIENAQLRHAIQFSPSPQYSLTGSRNALTSMPAANAAEQTRKSWTDYQPGKLERGFPFRAEDTKRTGSNDIPKVPFLTTKLQETPHVAASGSIPFSTPWPSMSVASTAQISPQSKDSSFLKASMGRSGAPQGALMSNSGRMHSSANNESTFNTLLSEDKPGLQSQTPFFSQPRMSQAGFQTIEAFGSLSSIEPPFQNTFHELKATVPMETSSKLDSGKTDKFQLPPSLSTSQKLEDSAPANMSFQRTALSDLQDKATVPQVGGLLKSEATKVDKPVIRMSLNTTEKIRSHESASSTASVTSKASNTFQSMSSADLQAKAPIAQLEDGKLEKSKATNELSTKESISKSFSIFETLSHQASSIFPTKSSQENLSPLNKSTDPAVPPQKSSTGFTVQANMATHPVVTACGDALASRPATFFSLASSSSQSSSTAGSASILFSSSNSMSTPTAISSPSNVLKPSTFGTSSEISSSVLNSSSVSPFVKAASFFNEGVISDQQTFPPAASMSTASSPLTVQGPPTISDEEDMEEEASNTFDLGPSSFAGIGLGSSTPSAGAQISSPFGASPFWSQSSSTASLSVPSGHLFRPASFSLPTPHSTSEQSSSNLFGNNYASGAAGGFGIGNSGFGSPAQPTASAFGQPVQPGASGQQALGSALGTFGQTRQIGTPFGVSSSATGFGFATGGDFASVATGGGFSSAATGGGFAGVGVGGGFAGVAAGGGFAGVAASGGFASAATGGGFAGFSSMGSFAGGGVGGTPSPSVNPGGLGAFSGGFSAFGGNNNSSIFTQMRK